MVRNGPTAMNAQPLRVLLLMNIGRPAPAAWRERLPRLDYAEVVSTL